MPTIGQTETQRRVAALSHARGKVRRELSRRKLLHFTTWTMASYEPSWHHVLLADTLDRVRTGEITRLLVFMPPQHGKSQLVSRHFPAHCLGCNPDTRIIATSYNDDLAAENGRAVRRIVRSPEFAQLYGERQVRRADIIDQASHFEMPGHQGSYLGAGIMAGMTGWGFDLGIIDDPIKNSQEADSPAYQKRLVQAWEEVFATDQHGTVVDGDRLIHQRGQT